MFCGNLEVGSAGEVVGGSITLGNLEGGTASEVAGDSDTLGNRGLAVGVWSMGFASMLGVESSSSITGSTAVVEDVVGASVGYINFIFSASSVFIISLVDINSDVRVR